MKVDVIEITSIEMSDYSTQYRITLLSEKVPDIILGEQEITFGDVR